MSCVFCPIPLGVEIVKEWNPNTFRSVVAFEPLNPVTPGHLLVVPRRHFPHVGSSPMVTAWVMEAASEVAALVGDCNVITSKGKHATQTVNHLHVHVVPRREGDGLHLPWTGQGEEQIPEPPPHIYTDAFGNVWQRTGCGGGSDNMAYAYRRVANVVQVG